MDNKTVYKKTLTFSLRRFLWDLGSVVVITIFAVCGFLIADKAAQNTKEKPAKPIAGFVLERCLFVENLFTFHFLFF